MTTSAAFPLEPVQAQAWTFPRIGLARRADPGRMLTTEGCGCIKRTVHPVDTKSPGSGATPRTDSTPRDLASAEHTAHRRTVIVHTAEPGLRFGSTPTWSNGQGHRGIAAAQAMDFPRDRPGRGARIEKFGCQPHLDVRQTAVAVSSHTQPVHLWVLRWYLERTAAWTLSTSRRTNGYSMCRIPQRSAA